MRVKIKDTQLGLSDEIWYRKSGDFLYQVEKKSISETISVKYFLTKSFIYLFVFWPSNFVRVYLILSIYFTGIKFSQVIFIDKKFVNSNRFSKI